MPAARLYLYLIAPFRLLPDGQPVSGSEQARLEHLLAYVVLHPEAPISRQQLALHFWPDSLGQQALKSLRTLLTRQRRPLPDAQQFIAVAAQAVQWQGSQGKAELAQEDRSG